MVGQSELEPMMMPTRGVVEVWGMERGEEEEEGGLLKAAL